MSTQFDTPEQARDYGAAMARVPYDPSTFREDPELRVDDMGFALARTNLDPTNEVHAKQIKDHEERRALQKGYRFNNVDGVEVGIVVDPFRDGWCVWLVSLSSGYCRRA